MLNKLYWKLYRYFKGVPHPNFLKQKFPILFEKKQTTRNLNTSLQSVVVEMYGRGIGIDYISGRCGLTQEKTKRILRKAEATNVE